MEDAAQELGPAQPRDFKRRSMTLEVPLQTLPGALRKRAPLDLGRNPGFDGPSEKDPNTLRFVFLEEELGDGCGEDPEEGLPIYEVPRTLQLKRPGVYTSQTGDGVLLRYRSETPLWASSRNLEFSPVLEIAQREKKIPGNRLYYLGLPGAIIADAFLTLITLGI